MSCLIAGYFPSKASSHDLERFKGQNGIATSLVDLCHMEFFLISWSAPKKYTDHLIFANVSVGNMKLPLKNCTLKY